MLCPTNRSGFVSFLGGSDRRLLQAVEFAQSLLLVAASCQPLADGHCSFLARPIFDLATV